MQWHRESQRQGGSVSLVARVPEEVGLKENRIERRRKMVSLVDSRCIAGDHHPESLHSCRQVSSRMCGAYI